MLDCEILRAAVDRIIPADEFGGAWDAGVGKYIERMLNGDLQHEAGAFANGLRELDSLAKSRFGKPFAALAAAQQDDILTCVESSPFFLLLLTLTSEGYYTDPGQISWNMIGYDAKANGPRDGLEL